PMAWSGVSTRVATTVAIALAVSWKPLIKSNATARTMTITSNSGGLGILDHHRPQYVGHILTAIGRLLKLFEDLFPANELKDLIAALNELAHRRARDAVGLV